jgi:hypothetical protein
MVQTVSPQAILRIHYPVSKAIALVAVAAPLLLAAEMIGNCWAHAKTREACDPDGQVPEMVQAVVTTVFAWMATPPR